MGQRASPNLVFASTSKVKHDQCFFVRILKQKDSFSSPRQDLNQPTRIELNRVEPSRVTNTTQNAAAAALIHTQTPYNGILIQFQSVISLLSSIKLSQSAS